MRIALFLLLTPLTAAGAYAQAPRRNSSTQDIEAKVALENSVEKRLQAVLRQVLNTDEVLVVVNAELLTEADAPDVEILPGVNVRETPGQPSPLGLPASLVRRVSVTLFLDDSASDERVALARKTTERLLGLKPDSAGLAVERMDFRKPAPSAGSLRDEILRPRALLSLSWLVMAALGLFVLSRRFFEPLVRALRDAGDAVRTAVNSAGGRQGDAAGQRQDPAAAAAEPPAAARAAAEEHGRKVPFAFITPRDVPTLIALLEGQPVQTIATVVHYLAPAVASSALAALPAEVREAVVAEMTHAVLLDPVHVLALEETIRARIDCLVGGEDKIADILSESPVRLQTEVLAALHASDEGLWERISRRLVMLEDIASLDESGLSALSRAVPLKSMAVALKTSPKVAEHVMSHIKTGLGEWLKQEIDLTGSLPPEAVEAEVRRVVAALTVLVKEGRVVLRKGARPHTNGNGSHPPEARPAEAPAEPDKAP